MISFKLSTWYTSSFISTAKFVLQIVRDSTVYRKTFASNTYLYVFFFLFQVFFAIFLSLLRLSSSATKFKYPTTRKCLSLVCAFLVRAAAFTCLHMYFYGVQLRVQRGKDKSNGEREARINPRFRTKSLASSVCPGRVR